MYRVSMGVDVHVKSEVGLWHLHAMLKVMDRWVTGMRVGWGWKGVHSGAQPLLEPSCSFRNHSLCPYPLHKYYFTLVQNEVYSFVIGILAKYSHQKDGWSAACVWETTALCMCSKL